MGEGGLAGPGGDGDLTRRGAAAASLGCPAIGAPAVASTKEAIAERLTEARERTLMLVEGLSEEQLNTVYSPLLSPLAWDLGHIASFEELWLVQEAGGREPMDGELGRLYDAIENPRATRNELPILRGDELPGPESVEVPGGTYEKFTRERIESSYADVGLELLERWTDPEGLYALSLARCAPV